MVSRQEANSSGRDSRREPASDGVWMTLQSCFLGLMALTGLAASGIPQFETYRVHDGMKGSPATPIIKTPYQRTFRTQITEEAKLGVNFAGHYRLAEWGCGSSCVSIAIINLQTGAVYDSPFRVLAYGTRRQYENGEEELEYRPESRLMIARGCPEDRNCGTYYFEWTGERFLRIRYVPAGSIIE